MSKSRFFKTIAGYTITGAGAAGIIIANIEMEKRQEQRWRENHPGQEPIKEFRGINGMPYIVYKSKR